MASLERLSEVPELMTWFRMGLRESGRSEEEIEAAEDRLHEYLAASRTRKSRKRKIDRAQLAMEVDEPELEWPAQRGAYLPTDRDA